MKIVFYSDPGHGWAAVPLADGRQDITYRATARQVANFVPLMGGAA